jgi:hypothetical protein
MQIENEYDTLLECNHCGRQSTAIMVELLKNGWFMCCNEAMHIISTDGKAVADAINSIRMRFNYKMRRWESA